MADVFVERTGWATDDERAILDTDTVGCFALHRVRWQDSYLLDQGRRMICHFRAPDAESVRLAFRQGGVLVDSIWTGTIHGESDATSANVIVERKFRPPLPPDAESALEAAVTETLAPNGFRLVQAIVPPWRERIICLCEAPAGFTSLSSPACVQRRVPATAGECCRPLA